MALRVFIFALLPAVIFAAEHESSGPASLTHPDCSALYAKAEKECEAFSKGQEGTLQDYIRISQKFKCDQVDFPDRRTTAFFRALKWEAGERKNSGPGNPTELLDLIDDLLITRLQKPQEPTPKRFFEDFRKLARSIEEPTAGYVARMFQELLDLPRTVHPKDSAEYLADALEFLPIFDPEKLSPLQNACGFFPKRALAYNYQPRLVALQLMLVMAFEAWDRNKDPDFPPAVYSLAKKLLTLDPTGRQFYLVAELMHPRFGALARVYLDEATGHQPHSPFILTQVSEVNSWNDLNPRKVGNRFEFDIPGHCEVAADPARSLGPAISPRDLSQHTPPSLLSARFVVATASTHIAVDLNGHDSFDFDITCYGTRLTYAMLTSHQTAYPHAEEVDYRYLAHAARAGHPTKDGSHQRSIRSNWGRIKGSPPKGLATWQVEAMNKLSDDVYLSNETGRPGGYTSKGVFEFPHYSPKTGFVFGRSPYLDLLTIENLHRPLPAISARSFEPHLRPLILTAIYEGDASQDNAVSALSSPPRLPKRLRRQLITGLKKVRVSQAATLFPLEERLEETKRLLKQPDPWRAIPIILALNAWDGESLQLLDQIRWRDPEYTTIARAMAKHAPEQFAKLLEAHFETRSPRFAQDVEAASDFKLTVPAMTEKIIQRMSAYDEETFIANASFLSVQAKAGDEKAFQYLYSTYENWVKQPSHKPDPREIAIRANFPELLLETGRINDLKPLLPLIENPTRSEYQLLFTDPVRLRETYHEQLGDGATKNLDSVNLDPIAQNGSAESMRVLMEMAGNNLPNALLALGKMGPRAKIAENHLYTVLEKPLTKDAYANKARTLAALALLNIDPMANRARVIPKLRRAMSQEGAWAEIDNDLVKSIVAKGDETLIRQLFDALVPALGATPPGKAAAQIVKAFGAKNAKNLAPHLTSKSAISYLIVKACEKDPAIRKALIPALLKYSPYRTDIFLLPEEEP